MLASEDRKGVEVERIAIDVNKCGDVLQSTSNRRVELEAPRVVEENEPLVREILPIGFVALLVSLFDERPAVWQLGELTRVEGRSVGLSGSILMHVLLVHIPAPSCGWYCGPR